MPGRQWTAVFYRPERESYKDGKIRRSSGTLIMATNGNGSRCNRKL